MGRKRGSEVMMLACADSAGSGAVAGLSVSRAQ